ncbi:MAG: GntR family transcriptional regulator, partial [Afipia sp.]
MIFEPEMPQGSTGDTPGVGEPGSVLARGATTAGKRTLAEELRLQLADDIVRGALEPGSALDESEIARRFNVS